LDGVKFGLAIDRATTPLAILAFKLFESCHNLQLSIEQVKKRRKEKRNIIRQEESEHKKK
jgi:hypothetical protein